MLLLFLLGFIISRQVNHHQTLFLWKNLFQSGENLITLFKRDLIMDNTAPHIFLSNNILIHNVYKFILWASPPLFSAAKTFLLFLLKQNPRKFLAIRTCMKKMISSV